MVRLVFTWIALIAGLMLIWLLITGDPPRQRISLNSSYTFDSTLAAPLGD